MVNPCRKASGVERGIVMNQRMNRERLNVGAYILQPYARTEAHIRDVKECGVDFIVSMSNDRTALDLFAKYGLGAIVNGVVPGWWGGDGSNAGLMAERNPMSRYEEAAAFFSDHPAIWGIDTGDEPSAMDFPHYGKVISFVDRHFRNQFAYINLYPNYASVSSNDGQQVTSQLGVPSYEEHIARYVQEVPTDYICYDFYLYSISVEKAFSNLWTVSDACRDSGRSMWIVLQVNSNRESEVMSLNQLRFQAYTAMAFGAETIIWGCYTGGWWYHNVLDKDGNKTGQYDKLKRMNQELHCLGQSYMRYRRTSTHFVGFSSDMRAAIDSYSDGYIMSLQEANGAPLVVGAMVGRNSANRAYFICACDDPQDEHTRENRVVFSAGGRTAILHRGDGDTLLLPNAQGDYTFELLSCQGALLEILE